MAIPADVEELAGSPRYVFDRRGGEGTREFKLLWDDLADFLELMIPPSYLEGTTVVVPPAANFPGLPWLTASSVSVERFMDTAPLDDANFPAKYLHAQVTITYRTEEYAQNESGLGSDGPGGLIGPTGDSGPGQAVTFVSQRVNIGGEFMSWPNGALQFGAPSDATNITGATSEDARALPEDQQIGVVIPTIEHSLTWHFCPYPPWRSIRSLVGTCNAYLFNGCPPETLLFLGAEASRELTNTGVRAWSLEYKCAEKAVDYVRPEFVKGWNHFLRSTGLGIGRWELVDRKPPLMFCNNRLQLNSGEATQIYPGSRSRWVDEYCAPFYVEMRDSTVQQIFRVTGSEDQGGGSPPAIVFNATNVRGEPLNNPHGWPENQLVKQVIRGVLNAPCSATDGWILVTGGGDFPDIGQFFVLVETGGVWLTRERMLVVERRSVGGGTERWRVLRGVRQQEYTDPSHQLCSAASPYITEPGAAGASAIAAHVAGDWVILEKMPLYPLGDFRYLFVSGLVTG